MAAKNIRKAYDSIAENYDVRHSNATARAMRHREEKLIEKYASGRVLDIGCGTGVHLSGNRIGIDVSSAMLGKAREKGSVAMAAAESLPFADESFDSALCMFTVLNLCDAEKAVKEMKRVLKKDGIIIVSVASIWDREKANIIKKVTRKQKSKSRNVRIYGQRLSFHLFTKDGFVSLFEKNDFYTEHIEGMFALQKPYWGWFREFTTKEKAALSLDRFLPPASAALIFGVFRRL